MRNLLFVLSFFASHISFAQDTTIFAPLGATWHYRPWTWGPDTGLYTFTAAGDTLLDGWNARIMRCAVWDYDTDAFQTVENLNKYIATVGEKVYYRVAGVFVLLFDFGAQPGDTIASKVEDFAIFNGCANPPGNEVFDFRYRIDSLGTITIDGINLRTQFVTTLVENTELGWDIGNYYGPITERIGAGHAGYWWGQGGACILAGIPGYLRCYDDNDLHYSNPGIGTQNCDYVSTKEPVTANLTITPNPAISTAQLPFIPDHIQVFNLLGQKINAPVSGTMLDVSSLVPGIYLVMIEKDGQWHSGKLVVAE